jgi:hypothetical protein
MHHQAFATAKKKKERESNTINSQNIPQARRHRQCDQIFFYISFSFFQAKMDINYSHIVPLKQKEARSPKNILRQRRSTEINRTPTLCHDHENESSCAETILLGRERTSSRSTG